MLFFIRRNDLSDPLVYKNSYQNSHLSNMMKIISISCFTLQSVVIVLSFAFSLRLMNNKEVPIYMKNFYLYPLVAIMVLIPIVLTACFSFWPIFGNLVNNISLIFHFSFLSRFIISVIPGNKETPLLRNVYWIFLLPILYFLFRNDLTTQNNQAFSISNLGLTFLCIKYYYRLFKNLPQINLKKEPSFWIVTGVFIGMSLHIPVSAMIDYVKDKISIFNYIILGNILLITYTIMHLFFIKAFICSSQKRKA